VRSSESRIVCPPAGTPCGAPPLASSDSRWGQAASTAPHVHARHHITANAQWQRRTPGSDAGRCGKPGLRTPRTVPNLCRKQHSTAPGIGAAQHRAPLIFARFHLDMRSPLAGGMRAGSTVRTRPACTRASPPGTGSSTRRNARHCDLLAFMTGHQLDADRCPCPPFRTRDHAARRAAAQHPRSPFET